jgi:hypothetical protein
VSLTEKMAQFVIGEERGRMEREYRGWTIAVNSYEAEKGRWQPVVTVSVETKHAEILTRRLFTPSE